MALEEDAQRAVVVNRATQCSPMVTWLLLVVC